MPLQPPPPPSISPKQMNLLRLVSSMAWADGDLAEEEIDVMLNRFSQIFAKDQAQQEWLQKELRDYLSQNIPMEELTPQLQSDAEKELVLKLGYEVIRSSSRTPTEEKINEEEAIAYEKLVQLLDLPQASIDRIESEVEAESGHSEGIIDSLTRQLRDFMQS